MICSTAFYLFYEINENNLNCTLYELKKYQFDFLKSIKL